jgi:exodeoxyribonuclease V alpha subunit
MWLERLRDMQLIDASAHAMGCYMQQHDGATSFWPSLLCALSMQALKNGHTCLDCKQLLVQFPALKKFPELLDSIDLNALLSCRLIGLDTIQEKTLFTYTAPYLFTNKFLALEQHLIASLAVRLNDKQLIPVDSTHLNLANLCIMKPMVLLSGGPGTGKTTVFAQAIPHWMQNFQQLYQRIPSIILCAPTGKAAARMSEAWNEQKTKLDYLEFDSCLQDAMPSQAITIHRLLAIEPISKRAKYNKQNPLSVDLLIVDEASMLDLPLWVQLLDALPETAHLLLIGDAQQLPAIEAGQILGSLLDAKSEHFFFKQLQLAHLHLTHNFRQQSNPGLTALATDCLNESAEMVADRLQKNDYAMVSWSDGYREQLNDLLKLAVTNYSVLARFETVDTALAAVRDFVILTAVRDGPNGCIAINADITQHLNPSLNRHYHGQVLLITENAKHLNLANGDIVMVWQLADFSLKAHFIENGRLQILDLDILPAHEPAYALTIHKAQGSEYSHVCVVLPTYESPILSKALLYTGITRAKNKLQLFALKTSLISCLNNVAVRINGLKRIAENLVQDKIQ